MRGLKMVVILSGGAVMAWLIYTVLSSPVPLLAWLQHPESSWLLTQGENPHPTTLRLPPVKPLSAVALIGRKLFYDPELSGSGKLSCASCHNPQHSYAPVNALSVQRGGADIQQFGVRAVPTLTYLYRQGDFSIGPANEALEDVTLSDKLKHSKLVKVTRKTTLNTQISAANLVPQGGLFWDGRADTLQQQALGPLLNPLEMDAGSTKILADKLAYSVYIPELVQLFGPAVQVDRNLLLVEALFALSRFQIEDPSFHAFTSKYDAWLQGQARFTPAELSGYLVFNDPNKGNCAACHLDQPTRDRLPPLFTDSEYEALGVPRNPNIPANHDQHYDDLGVCGPYRTDLKNQTQYCGMFLTPTLRNAATRQAFFHNGAYHTLNQVLNFYALRDVAPQNIYPVDTHGKVDQYNDIPATLRANVDVSDAPFNRKLNDPPAFNAQDAADLIAFLRTLNDGYAGAH